MGDGCAKALWRGEGELLKQQVPVRDPSDPARAAMGRVGSRSLGLAGPRVGMAWATAPAPLFAESGGI